MAGKVIERLRHWVDDAGTLRFDDRPATWERADGLSGRRLDRRRNYAIIGGEVCQSVRWTDDCSGCTEFGDYGTKYGGGGCKECGYTGKSRRSYWVPIPAPCDRNPEGEDPQGLRAEHESAVPEGQAPTRLTRRSTSSH